MVQFTSFQLEFYQIVIEQFASFRFKVLIDYGSIFYRLRFQYKTFMFQQGNQLFVEK